MRISHSLIVLSYDPDARVWSSKSKQLTIPYDMMCISSNPPQCKQKYNVKRCPCVQCGHRGCDGTGLSACPIFWSGCSCTRTQACYLWNTCCRLPSCWGSPVDRTDICIYREDKIYPIVTTQTSASYHSRAHWRKATQPTLVHWPVWRSHMRAVRSHERVISRWAEGLNWRQVTSCVWPYNVCTHCCSPSLPLNINNSNNIIIIYLQLCCDWTEQIPP